MVLWENSFQLVGLKQNGVRRNFDEAERAKN